MKRREIITILCSAAIWPLAARAQQKTMPVIGYLANRSAGDSVDLVAAFHQGLKEAGYAEGQNAAIEFRWADNQYDRLPVLAADLVRRRVAVIFAQGAPAAVVAKAATATIPTVFYMGEDPVSLGLVHSFNRPGGNMTGVGDLGSAVLAKRLELLREVVPQASVFAALLAVDLHKPDGLTGGPGARSRLSEDQSHRGDHRYAEFHQLLARRGNCLERPRVLGLLRWRHR